ncbi:hypothetical protein NQZ68_001848 [Dissostichus eleginoides]|nr:hypothetical protein NQZ68_001848 [Dissostichus eleginoides]
MVFGCLGGVSRWGESLQERPLLPHSPRCLCRVAAVLEDLSPPREVLSRAWSLWRVGVAGSNSLSLITCDPSPDL